MRACACACARLRGLGRRLLSVTPDGFTDLARIRCCDSSPRLLTLLLTGHGTGSITPSQADKHTHNHRHSNAKWHQDHDSRPCIMRDPTTNEPGSSNRAAVPSARFTGPRLVSRASAAVAAGGPPGRASTAVAVAAGDPPGRARRASSGRLPPTRRTAQKAESNVMAQMHDPRRLWA
eukprot:3507477-Prymnesium_polylepis.1